MKKLNQTQRAFVEECRAKVAELERLQDEAYSELCKRIDCDSDWLFDYVFNSSVRDSKYDALVQEKLFE